MTVSSPGILGHPCPSKTTLISARVRLGWEVMLGYLMRFWKHLRRVSRAATRSLGILSKSWRVFHDQSLLVRCFQCSVLPVLKYCSAVWCNQWRQFPAGGVLECNISHHRSVAVLCILHTFRTRVTLCIHFALHCLFLLSTWGLHVGSGLRTVVVHTLSPAGLKCRLFKIIVIISNQYIYRAFSYPALVDGPLSSFMFSV